MRRALARRQRKVAEAIKNSSTMTEEAAKLSLLGLKDVRELEKMSPQEAYVLDRKAVHDRLKIPAATIKRKSDTLKIKILGVASEEEGLLLGNAGQFDLRAGADLQLACAVDRALNV